MSRFYPQDVVLPKLLQKLGGATQFKIDPSLTRHQMACIKNYLLVKDVKTVISGYTITMAIEPGYQGPVIDYDEETRTYAEEKE